MKRILSLMLVFLGVFVLSGCNRGPVLYVLNWNEYINEDLVAEFEEEFGVRVRFDFADSNEAMYTKINARTTNYDIAIPSDYMIHKLKSENLLNELDFDLLPNYNSDNFDPVLEALRDNYFAENQSYAVPYFWGSLGIMYNEQKAGLKFMVEEHGWRVFFDAELTQDARVTMYNSSRDAVAVGLMHLGHSVNTKVDAHYTEVEQLLSAQNYFAWGTDNLKEMVANGNADIALVYSGDFFDMLYATLEDEEDVTYNMYVPDTNNIWFDAMVIPTTSQNVLLAHQFINFMMDHDNALENAFEIGYCPVLTSVYDVLLDDEDYSEIIESYPYYPGTITNGTVYEYLGHELYNRMEIILLNAQG